MRPATSVFPQTFSRVTGKDLLEFMQESHRERCNELGSTQGTAPESFRGSLLDVDADQAR